jgi:ABC-2 type transport system ATP-binding protein
MMVGEEKKVMIETLGLTKRYEDGLLALDHLDLEVREGEIFCLLGANGAGKTTAINLLLNLIDPTEGIARVNGIDVAKKPLEAKRFVSFVSERVSLYENFTAMQNLRYFAMLGGVNNLSWEEGKRVFSRIALNEAALDQRVRNFSKGMVQKLGIAVAMVKDAPVILLDEPTTGLDPKAVSELLNLLREFRENGKAVFMSTHDIFRAREIADRVGIMKEGKLITVMDIEDLARVDLEKIYLDYMKEGDSISHSEMKEH